MCHDNKNDAKLTGIDLSVQNWHDEFDKFWPVQLKISEICTLMGCLWPKCIRFKLKKHIAVMFDGTEYWCKIWRKTDLYFQKCHREFGKFDRLKNSDLILKKKMAELNQNQNSKQPDQPDAVQELYFTLEINE